MFSGSYLVSRRQSVAKSCGTWLLRATTHLILSLPCWTESDRRRTWVKRLGNSVEFFPQQQHFQHFAMGSLAQISSGAIRCSFNIRFRARFRRVHKVLAQVLRLAKPVRLRRFPVQTLRSGSGRVRRRRFWRRRFRWKYLDQFQYRYWGEASEGSSAESRGGIRKVPGAVIWWGTMWFQAIIVDCVQWLNGGFA